MQRGDLLTGGSSYGNLPSSFGKRLSRGSGEKKGFFSKVIDVVNTPANVISEGAKYLMEEATGKDFYQNGAFTKALKFGGSEGWAESLRRAGVQKGAGAIGLVLDIATDPFTWLGGAGALRHIGKAGRLAKTGANATSIAGIVNKGVDLSQEMIKATNTLNKLDPVVDIAKVTKLRSEIDVLEKGLQGVATALQTAPKLKLTQVANKVNLLGSTAVAGKGIADFIGGDTKETKLSGALLTALGALGVRGSIVDTRTINSVLKASKSKTDFAKKFSTVLLGGRNLNAAELAVVNKQGISGMAQARAEKALKIANKYDIQPIEATGQMGGNTEAISRNIEYGTPLPAHLDNPEVKELVNLHKWFVENDKAIRDVYGLESRDVDSYTATRLIKRYADGRVERVDPTKDAMNWEALNRLSEQKRGLRDVMKGVRQDADSTKFRKYDTDTRNKVLGEHTFADEGGEFVFQTPHDIIGSLDLMRKRVIKEGGNYALINSLKKADNPYEVQSIYDSMDLKKTRDANRADLRSEVANIKGATKILRESMKGATKEQRQVLSSMKAKKKIQSTFDAVVQKLDQEREDWLAVNPDAKVGDLKKWYAYEDKRIGELFKESNKSLTKAKNDTLSKIFDKYRQKNQDILNEIGAKQAEATQKYGLEDLSKYIRVKGSSGLMVSPEIGRGLQNVLEKTNNQDMTSLIGSVIKNIKLGKVTGDLFTYGQGARAAISTGWTLGGFKGIKEMFSDFRPITERLDELDDALRHGLQMGRTEDIGVRTVHDLLNPVDPESLNPVDKFFQDLVVKAEKLPKPIASVIKLFEKNERFAFGQFMPALKMNAYKKLKTNFITKGMDADQAGFAASKMANDIFFGQNWEMLMAKYPALNKRMLDLSRILIFAPDYLVSNMSRAFGGGKVGAVGEKRRQELITASFLGLTMTEMANFAMTGHSTLENTPGNELSVEIPSLTDVKGNPLAVSLMGNWAEPLKVFQNPTKYLLGKQGGILKAVSGLSSGRATLAQTVGENTPIPISTQSIIQWGIDNKLLGQEKTGVPDSFIDAMVQYMLETVGIQGAYRSGKNTDNFIQRIAEAD